MPQLKTRPAAVFFDLDGTLVDTADDLAAPVNHMREARGLKPLPLEEYRPFASAGSRGLLHIGLGATTDDPDYPALRTEFLNRYEQEIAVHSRLFDGMPELLAWLEANGIRWGVISNKLEYLVHRLVQQLGLGHRVALAYGGDTAPRAKPWPDPLKMALQETGLTARQCVYIGDDLRDIQAAHAVDMPAVAAAYGYGNPNEIPQWKADHIVTSPQEFLAMLKRLPA
ncbi:HAD-IA family hydrolase [Lautropia mirabilis]|uniref:HAD family hydrolase n=1 Tax=Lautropia mirabilis TaxID=47671 RepID=UPI0028D7CF6C|nr:HAD-IA family hydrolase [Lautropia mirabilis]